LDRCIVIREKDCPASRAPSWITSSTSRRGDDILAEDRRIAGGIRICRFTPPKSRPAVAFYNLQIEYPSFHWYFEWPHKLK
jgi:hypothetical protein